MAGPDVKRILVTGASGTLGRHCLPLLVERGFEVHGVTRQSPLSMAGTQWHFANLLEDHTAEALLAKVRPTHLLHLAWTTQPGLFWSSPENHAWLDRSLRLFRAFQNIGGQRLVATGSCAEYDWSAGVCHEATTPCRPSTLYGRAKLAAATYLDTLASGDLTTAWARLFFLYGPHTSDRRMPGVVISSLLRNESVACSEGTQLRDFLHIADAADAVVRLTDSDLPGPINVCSGIPLRIADVAIRAAEILGRTDLLRLGALPSPVHEPALLVGDSSRLRSELGWQMQFTLDEGLRQTIEFCQRQQTARAA